MPFSRYSDLSLPGRLAARSEFEASFGVSPLGDSSDHAGVRVSVEQENAIPHPLAPPIVPKCLLFFSSQELAEIPGTSSQFYGSLSLLRLLHLHFLMFSSHLRDPPYRLVPFFSSGQEPFSVLGLSGLPPSGQLSPPRRITIQGGRVFLNPFHLSGEWSPLEAHSHINFQELRAVFLALKKKRLIKFSANILVNLLSLPCFTYGAPALGSGLVHTVGYGPMRGQWERERDQCLTYVRKREESHAHKFHFGVI